MPTLGTAISGQTTASSTLTVGGMTTSGSNKAVWAGVGTSSSVPDLTSSVTFAGTGMTEDWDFLAGSFHNSGHHMVAPAGSGNLVATIASAQDEFTLFGVPLSDVDQTTPIGTVPANQNGISTTASVTVSSAVGELVLAMFYSWWGGVNPGAGETKLDEQKIGGTTPLGAIFSQAGATPNVVISPTQSAVGGADDWLINGVSFKPPQFFTPVHNDNASVPARPKRRGEMTRGM